jgi:lipoate-protein ligase A
MRQWRLMYDQPTDGILNMAVDEALLSSGIPTLRLYAWKPFCLSLGYGQRCADVDKLRLDAAGWNLVRRPSGGRAILHAEELTYSLILPREHEIAALSIVESYRRISEGLLRALQSLGAAVEAREATAQRVTAQPVCFEMAAQYESAAAGRKLVGSAQLRRKVGVLQHGSIPLQGDPGRICEVLAYEDAATRDAAKQQLRARATTLSEALGGATVSWWQVAEALAKGFSEVFEVEFYNAGLTSQELTVVERLAKTVYGDPAWTWRR